MQNSKVVRDVTSVASSQASRKHHCPSSEHL